MQPGHAFPQISSHTAYTNADDLHPLGTCSHSIQLSEINVIASSYLLIFIQHLSFFHSVQRDAQPTRCALNHNKLYVPPEQPKQLHFLNPGSPETFHFRFDLAGLT